ncbi:hypothetical protein LY13_005003 [Prauserella aidingensis]|uniref:hypothetical protein n=1 Tax=Prauserella aidingensis TaxID=387890 RepID=UPI0020A2D0A6|nr:hypothetical protein [Prauserella aidingensis]MCP2256216.1 hypothetical protein [Prauserella aidingensis]
MTTVGTTYGTGVGLSGGGVQLAQGTYTINYTWQADASGDGTVLSELTSAYLVLGGVEVAGSRIKATTATAANTEGQVANEVTVTVPAGGQWLSLYNGARAATHSSSLAGITGSINVTRVG